MGMSEILVNDIFKFAGSVLAGNTVKVRFLVPNPVGVDPLEEYLINPTVVINDWTLYWNKKKPFQDGDTVLTFCRKGETWLFVAAKKITGIDSSKYTAVDIPELQPYCGRLVIRYDNHSQNMVRLYSRLHSQLVVHELLAEPYCGDHFPGYEKIEMLSFKRLRSIVERQIPDWVTALSNVKAVYLITDSKSNKLYVGSATSNRGMLLQRWNDYVTSGHGGDVEFKHLDFDYIQSNFHFSILDHFTSSTSDDVVIAREQVWKNRLRTRCSGYNKN